jgi:uncharacterized protein (DUF1501 family)
MMPRRGFLGQLSASLGGIALADLAARSAHAGATIQHHPARAQRVLQIFCPGGASHIDLWDFKPELLRRSGEPLPGEPEVSFQGKNGNLMRSPWAFIRRGASGKPVNQLLERMGEHVDQMAFLHSMTSRSNTHGPGCVFMNTGSVAEGFPAAGAWVSHALGSGNQDLPTYVAIPDARGEPPNGQANWSHGFLPASCQGISLAAHRPIRNLQAPAQISAAEDAATQQWQRALDDAYAQQHPGESELLARLAAYQLAGRMQVSAPQVMDWSQESTATLERFGANDANPHLAAYARNCLLAKRLLEQGVRYVNLYCASRASGVDGLLNWDAHKTLKEDYERHIPIFDRPTAALLTALREGGLLDDTLVIWTTEFGRMPTHQEGTTGRDHNPDGFTCWLMGAGVRPGSSYGATDPFGRRAVENPTTVWDLYATVLHLLGIDHQRLTWYHNGADRRLTDVHGHVIQPILG